MMDTTGLKNSPVVTMEIKMSQMMHASFSPVKDADSKGR